MRRTVCQALLLALLGAGPGCAVTPIQLPAADTPPPSASPYGDRGTYKSADTLEKLDSGTVAPPGADLGRAGRGDGSGDLRPCDGSPAVEGGPPESGPGQLDTRQAPGDAARAAYKDT